LVSIMPLSLIAFLIGQGGIQDSAVVAKPAPTFETAPVVAESRRIALTPTLDGVIGDEEWDPLSTEKDAATYWQWEPGRMHVAAQVPVGTDLLLSLDLGANGWLIGRDNLEFRLHVADGKVITTARLLDGTVVTGPQWIELPGFTISSAGSVKTDGNTQTIEATISDPGIGLLSLNDGKTLSIRADTLDALAATSPAYLPRILAPVTLGYFRSAGLPNGLTFRPEGASRSVVPGQSLGLRMTFEGKGEVGVTRLDLRGEGPARAVTNLVEVPFPTFDRKGRCFVDYTTNVSPEATLGYRLLRGTLQTKDGVPGATQTSFRIGWLVDADLVREDLKPADMDRSQKMSFYLRSNSGKSMAGTVKVSLPEPLRVINDSIRGFEIGRSRGGSRQVFEFYIPRGTKGTFPVTFDLNVNKTTMTQVGYITIP
jgi:hypothetical protein